jgi:hypothetical protein
MRILPTTCICPNCGKVRRMHTKKESAVCSAWTKNNLKPAAKAKQGKPTEVWTERAGKFFATIDK